MLFSVILPSAMAMTLGKVTTRNMPENMLCRVPRARHSAKVACLPSVFPAALGTVATFAECLSQRRSAKRRPLPSA